MKPLAACSTEEYLHQVRVLERLDPDAVSEFLVLAATLIELKLRALLPPPPPVLDPVAHSAGGRTPDRAGVPGGKLKLALLLVVGTAEFYFWHRLPAKVRAEGMKRLAQTVSKFLLEVTKQGQTDGATKEDTDARAPAP